MRELKMINSVLLALLLMCSGATADDAAPASPAPDITTPAQLTTSAHSSGDLTTAATAGDAPAQVKLADQFIAAGDSASAIHWLQAAAQQENVAAQLRMAEAYLTGRGVTQSVATAVEWYGRAGRNGSALAQRQLADAYASGQGVAVDQAQAIHWYRAAAD